MEQTARRPGVGLSVWRWIREVLIVVVAAIALSFLLKTFLIQSFYIPSQSMENTFAIDDRVMVSKLAPGPLQVHHGDVVVFRDTLGWIPSGGQGPERTGAGLVVHSVLEAVGLAPSSATDYLIKRIIGLPGDTVSCEGNGAPVFVNGVPISETYLKPGVSPSSLSFSITVPEGRLWVMGDNRAESADSRLHQVAGADGTVALSDVVGVALVRTWPFSRFGVLHNPGAVFENVPTAAEPGKTQEDK